MANELGVLQLTVLFPVFFAFDRLARFVKTPDYRHGLILGFWAVATYLSSSYFGLHLSLFPCLAAVLTLAKERRPESGDGETAAAGEVDTRHLERQWIELHIPQRDPLVIRGRPKYSRPQLRRDRTFVPFAQFEQGRRP